MNDLPPDGPPVADARRQFLLRSGAALAAPLLGTAGAAATEPSTPSHRTGTAPRRDRPYNLLFVFTDQQRHVARWPSG